MMENANSRKYSWIQLTFSLLFLYLLFSVSQSAVYLLQVSLAQTVSSLWHLLHSNLKPFSHMNPEQCQKNETLSEVALFHNVAQTGCHLSQICSHYWKYAAWFWGRVVFGQNVQEAERTRSLWILLAIYNRTQSDFTRSLYSGAGRIKSF